MPSNQSQVETPSHLDSNKSQELAQFLKEFEKKKNFQIMLSGEDEGDDIDGGGLGPREIFTSKKNKILMSKMFNLMTQKSKNRIRWE